VAESLLFITPAFGRFSLTRVCLAQRRWVCDEMRRQYGIEATCVVVADDANLDTAREFGFETVAHANDTLGMKFNAGYRHAAKLGIDHVFPIGSDSWIDPDYFDALPEPNELLLSRAYNLVRSDLGARGALWIDWEGGVQWITRTADWAHRNYEPISAELRKGCDTSTWLHRKPGIQLQESFHHQLEYVAFQSPEQQITSYSKLMAKYGTGEVFAEHVIHGLTHFYRAEDIQRLRLHYATEQVALLEQSVATAFLVAGEEQDRLSAAQDALARLVA
jgi:hypothetical protein